MSLSLDLLCFVLALSVPIYWTIPSRALLYRHSFIASFSLLILFYISPVIAFTVIGYGTFIVLARVTAIRGWIDAKTMKKLSWFAFFPLVLPEFISSSTIASYVLGAAWVDDPNLLGFAYLGLAFTGIRAFLIVRETTSEPRPSLSAILTSLTFFGSYLAGPIAGGKAYSNLSEKLSLYNLAMGLSRIGWGAALVLIIAPRVGAIDLQIASGTLANWAEMYRKFVVLFLDFSGASTCAIGIALLYGVTLPENFRFPLLATSVQDFWQRWHISFSSLIGTYLFKPMVRATGRTSFSLITSFALVGLWHHISLQYIVWGIGHGTALAVQMKLNKHYKIQEMGRRKRILILISGWLFTITYVSFLSSFANSASWPDALSFAARLTGI
jgi:alginate O-acetyltransferase complex protein AlgI